MEKILYSLLFLLLAIITAEMGYYFFYTTYSLPKKRKNTLPTPSPIFNRPKIKPVFGVETFKLSNGKVDIVKGTGIFETWEKIPGSKDLYALLINPETGEKYKIRILVEKTALSEPVGSDQIKSLMRNIIQITNSDFFGSNRTRLVIEGKEYFFYNLSSDELNKRVQKGMIITFYPIPHTAEEAEKTGQGIRRDKNNVPVAVSFVVD